MYNYKIGATIFILNDIKKVWRTIGAFGTVVNKVKESLLIVQL